MTNITNEDHPEGVPRLITAAAPRKKRISVNGGGKLGRWDGVKLYHLA